MDKSALDFKKINLGVFNGNEEFFVSNFNMNSIVSLEIEQALKGIDVDLFIYSEIKGSLDIEGDGSSRKIISDLISGKKMAQNETERKALNLYNAYNFILLNKPSMNKKNLMTIYNILTTDIDMKGNELENNFSYRQNIEEGFVEKFKTPKVENMEIGMNQLFEFINSDKLSNFPMEKALMIQVLFIFFHPFYDFNGRTGRIMTFWYLVMNNLSNYAKVSLISLPANKDKYKKIWRSLRATKTYDLTLFMNWLGCISMHSAIKIKIINDLAKKNGINLSETEILIMFYLLDINHFIQANDLKDKIDLGISKQGFFNALNSLNKKKVIDIKMSSNKMLVQSKKVISDKNDSDKLFERFIKSNNDHSLHL